jgi:hypothetical protein
MASPMSQARAMMTAALRAGIEPDEALRGYPLRFEDYAKQLEPFGGVTVMTAVHTTTREPNLGPDGRGYEATVYVVTETVDPGAGDDELEAALEDALGALDAAQLVTWERAERTVFGRDLWPCYEITATAHAQIERNTP